MPEPRRRSLRSALTSRPAWGQALVAVLLGALGFAAALQVRVNDAEGVYPGARRGDLIELLDSLDAANARAEKQINELETTKRELQTSTTASQTALLEARREASTLAILAGTVPARGPGVVIRINDPEAAVSAVTMLNAIEELRDAGAEAIEINNSARVVAQTYFAVSDGTLTIDGAEVRPPYVIDAVGSAATLSVAVGFPGGLQDEVQALGGSVTVEQTDALDVTALAEERTPEYAQPAP
ncbi:MAG: DUF881 domain-containing protein [Nocardioidaceae bacterium]|nr:DUF881 domain-containing protein [Nocardioidaceae bacterium]